MALAMQHSLASSGVSAENADTPRLLSVVTTVPHGGTDANNKKRSAPGPAQAQIPSSAKPSVLVNRMNTKDVKRVDTISSGGADVEAIKKRKMLGIEVRKPPQNASIVENEGNNDKENYDFPDNDIENDANFVNITSIPRRSLGKRSASTQPLPVDEEPKKRRGNNGESTTLDIRPKQSKIEKSGKNIEEDQQQQQEEEIEDERLTISQTRNNTLSTKLTSSSSSSSISPASYSSLSSSLFISHSRSSSSSSIIAPLSPISNSLQQITNNNNLNISSFSQFADFSFYLTRSSGLKYALTVMEFLSPKDIFTCACVCRVWAILLRKGNTAAPPATHALTVWNNNYPSQPRSSRAVLFQNTSDEHSKTPFNDFSTTSTTSVISSTPTSGTGDSVSPVQLDRSLQTAGHRLYHHAYNLRESLVIYRSLQARQHNIRVRSDYMKFQRDYNAKMRTILTDWMLQVNMEFDNDSETAALAVRMCDCLFSGWEIQRKRIQLVGVTCILLASKLLETHYPDLKELLYLCDGIYDRPELLRMESEIVKRMSSHMQAPTALTFYRHFQFHLPLSLPASQCLYGICAQDLSHLAHEIALLEYDFIGFEPCILGCALYIFGAVYTGQSYHQVLDYTGYSLSDNNDLNSCCKLLDNWVKNMQQMQLAHIEKRYKDDRRNILKVVQKLDYALIVECNRAVQKKENQEQADIIV